MTDKEVIYAIISRITDTVEFINNNSEILFNLLKNLKKVIENMEGE